MKTRYGHGESAHLNTPIRHMVISDGMSADDLVAQMGGCGFGARHIAVATDILEEMQQPGVYKLVGLAGAMVPAGMQRVISDMIREGMIDALVTTGANMTHDLIEATGGHHHQGNEFANDKELKEQNIFRIYDVYLPKDSYLGGPNCFDETLSRIYESMDTDRTYSITEFMDHVGSMTPDKHSILRSAHDMHIPIYCPAIQDSEIGMYAWWYNDAHPENNISVDAFQDMKPIIKNCKEAEKTGALLLGGGVPKNYILQAALLSRETGHDYVVQITMDRQETGGLSGATLEEAQSWGKVGHQSKTMQVFCDTTIALPLMLAAVKQRMKAKKE